jgi:DNA-binding winged helix-turn-helix (wHTH) protein/pimeloyl-ACP methyl ester carboxylesterase
VSTSRAHDISFAGYRFEAETGRLWSGSREIRLTPKASEVLTQLVLHAGEPVSKADLFATVWSGTAVSDDALTSCIQELRRALDDDSKQPRFIETRHRRGYRFVAELSRAEPAHPAAVAHVSRPGRGLEQEIRFCTTSDGVSLAYSLVGAGPYIVRVLGHFTHLEAEWEWPDLRRFWERLAEHHTVVRYDGRGIGLSDRYTGEFTEETRQRDLEAVLSAIGAEKAVLLGISEGGWTAATYAVSTPGADHAPRAVRRLLSRSACTTRIRSRRRRGRRDIDSQGMGRDTPAFRQIITSQFFRRDSDPDLIARFNDLQRLSADPDTAARYHVSCHRRGDGTELYRQLRMPVLIIHSQEDSGCHRGRGPTLGVDHPRQPTRAPAKRRALLPDRRRRW